MTLEESGQKGMQSAGVIYSFKFRWIEDIQSGRIGVFFRKKWPAVKPNKVFICAGAPASSIVSVAEVERMKDVDLDRAFELADLGRISNEELKSYIGPNRRVKDIFLYNHQLLQKPLGINELRKIFSFHPPQSFVRISREIEKKILEASIEK